LLESVVYVYFAILEPSYMSVQHSCGDMSDAELKSNGYRNVGNFAYGYKNESKNKINIFVPDYYDNSWQSRNLYMLTEEYDLTMKHEKIHKRQYSQNRLWNCDHKFRLFLNEIEANIGMRFPTKIWRKLYA